MNMSHDGDDSNDSRDRSGLSRRTFVQATGTVAALGGVGASAAPAAAHNGFHTEFSNPRVWELGKVWEGTDYREGFRGRPSRSVGVGDTGCDGRHPDLTWNDVRIVEDGDDIGLQRVRVTGDGDPDVVGNVEPRTGQLGPGVADAGQVDRDTYELDVPDAADEVDVRVSWTPQRQDNELLLLDEDGNEKASSTDFNPLSGEGERIKAPVGPGDRVRVETYANVAADYEITGEYLESPISFEELPTDEFSMPETVDADTPKLVGWKGGTFAVDGDGHGSHVSSISAGSGQGSAVDESTVTEEEPRTVLLPGEVLEYEVTPEGGNDAAESGGVYASVYGTNLEVDIEAPNGETVESTSVTSDSSVSGDATVAEAYAAESGTYNVYVRPTDDVAGTGGARVERVSVGALLPPSGATGDRTGEQPSLHAGVAPNASLVTIQGLGNALSSLSEFADFYTDTFGLRTANFSYGGLPTERAGLSDTYQFVEQMAEGGILTVSSAGNNGPLTGATGPSGASEAICTAATGPMDGLTAYTSGGTVVRDEDGEVYRKPDVTAPGGTLDDLVNAVEAGDPDADGPVRNYTGKAGTSMAAPYVNGVAGLVAEAMEFGGDDRPEGLTLPRPSETGREDVLRLKQVVLATASETAFTAATYHRDHAPTYDFGERDQFEGYGRVNPDAAVDAVTRELSPGSHDGTVGLNRHTDARAVAGYLPGDAGTYDLDLSVSHLSGGNTGMAKGDAHVDLYVYDIADAGPYGEPSIVARSMGTQGDASVSVTVGEEDDGAYVAVAKLVNVPGVVNGYDVQAHLDLDVEFEAPPVVISGSREDDGSVFTGGQTDKIDLQVETREPVEFRDVVPIEWDIDDAYGDVDHVHENKEAGVKYVNFTGHGDGAAVDSASVTYFAEAPEGSDETGRYSFGPAEVSTDGDTWIPVGGTGDTNYVVGRST